MPSLAILFSAVLFYRADR